MKKPSFLLLLSFMFGQFVAQQDQSFDERKLTGYKKMKKTGTILTVAGAGLAIVGTVLVIDSGYDPIGDWFLGSNPAPQGAQEVIGVTSLLTGVGMMGAGIPLAIVGSKKSKRYEEKSKAVSINMRVAPQRTTVGLTFRF